MNQTANQITFFQLSLILFLCVGLTNHVLILPLLMSVAGRDAWLAVLATSLLVIPWAICLSAFLKRSNQEKVSDWLAARFGRVSAWLYITVAEISLFFLGAMTLRDTTNWTTATFLPQTPAFVVALALVLVGLFAARYDIRTIAITSGVLLPFVIVFGYFVMGANYPHKDFSLLFPVLEKGPGPLFHGVLYVFAGVSELILLVYSQQYLSTKPKTWQVALLAVLLMGLTFGPAVGAIAEFGPAEAAKQRYPAYEQWRLVKIGRYIEHVDFLSIYQWLAGATTRMSVVLFLMTDLLPVKTKRRRMGTLLLISFFLLLVSLLPIFDMRFLMALRQYYFPVFLIVALLLTAILLSLSFVSRKPRRASS
ncbi:germination protein [Paenibacillus sp. J31TS4]|uniref:GerAB/ArcD/ProY family transporter n=1 Tax=Paenibacillus sp. J31TS4 TaxID=2807195 RepID=UPI001B146B3B|nr:endospore germination permease [Paenibacillus sp. J31TS4]GIP37221.1 germination protein [Paenibacillus sp. J31TS4]